LKERGEGKREPALVIASLYLTGKGMTDQLDLVPKV